MVEDPKKLDRLLEKCLRGVEEKGWTVQDCLTHYPALQGEFEPILRAAVRLRESRKLRPSAQFRARSPHKLKARMQISQRPSVIRRKTNTHDRRQRSRFGPKLLMKWATPLLGVALTTTVALAALGFAADSAGPGDLLYKFDRAMENIQLQLTQRNDVLARLRLDFASERLDEAIQLIEQGRPENVAETLEDYQIQINAAVSLINAVQEAGTDSGALVLSASETLTTHEEQLEELLVIAPSSSQPDIEVAIEEVEIILVIVAPPDLEEDDIHIFGTTTPAATTIPPTTPTPSPTATFTPTSTATPTAFDDELLEGTFTPAPIKSTGTSITPTQELPLP